MTIETLKRANEYYSKLHKLMEIKNFSCIEIKIQLVSPESSMGNAFTKEIAFKRDDKVFGIVMSAVSDVIEDLQKKIEEL